MEMKSVLLLLVIGLAAVAAKKGSSEEDDRLGPYGPWMNGRPGRGPKPFKFKNPKHHIQFPVYVVSAPEYAGNRPMPTQQPQYVQEMPGPQPMNGFDIQQYFENIQRNMAKVSEKVYSEFQSVDAEIERNRQNMENALINQFKNMQSMLFAKRAKEIQAAVKEGKDQEKIESCLKDQEEVFKAEVNMDVKRNSDCLNDATFRARQTLNGARNLYTEKSAMNAYQVKDLAHEMNACVNQGDYHCAYEKMAAINQRIKATVEEGAKQLEKIQDAPRQQMIQSTYCRQNFMQDFREMRAEYNDLVKKCVSSVEVPKLPVEVPQVPVQVPNLPVEVPQVPVQVPEVPAVEVPKVPEVAPELPSAEVESNEEIDA